MGAQRGFLSEAGSHKLELERSRSCSQSPTWNWSRGRSRSRSAAAGANPKTQKPKNPKTLKPQTPTFGFNRVFFVQRRRIAAGDVEQKNADNPKAGTKFGSSAPKKKKRKQTTQVQREVGAKIDLFSGRRGESVTSDHLFVISATCSVSSCFLM